MEKKLNKKISVAWFINIMIMLGLFLFYIGMGFVRGGFNIFNWDVGGKTALASLGIISYGVMALVMIFDRVKQRS